MITLAKHVRSDGRAHDVIIGQNIKLKNPTMYVCLANSCLSIKDG